MPGPRFPPKGERRAEVVWYLFGVGVAKEAIGEATQAASVPDNIKQHLFQCVSQETS